MSNVRWRAKLTDGTTAVEEEGEWVSKSGERLPWVRLAESLGDKVFLESLELDCDGRVISLPGTPKLGIDQEAPKAYSLQYFVEIDNFLGNRGFKSLVDVISHFEDYEVHLIQEVELPYNSWILVTKGWNPLCLALRTP